MRQRLLNALMIAAITFASGTMAMADGKNYSKLLQPNTERNSQEGNQGYIAKEARHELTMLPNYSLFDWLEYKVEDNTVILSGEVVRPTLKSEAENVVSRIKGVERVVNQIEVLPLSQMDEKIRMREARVIFNFNTPLYHYGLQAVPSIHIIVKNGNVILKGVVNSQADSNLANIRARGVSNVFAVDNELKVVKG